MKTRLNAGSEIDILSQGELRDELERLLDLYQQVAPESSVFDVETRLVADGAGAIAATEIFDIPLGYLLTVHRYHLNAPGVTPAAPLSGAAYWLMVFRNDPSLSNLFMFFPVSGTVISPVVVTEGGDARILRGGTKIVVTGGGFPANQAIYMNLQCQLTPIPVKREGLA